MEKHTLGPVSAGAAREQLQAARQAHDASVRRARTPAGLILALSFFCGALALAPAHKEPGNVTTIIAVVWFVAELLNMSAHNQWRALRSLPRPKWNLTEATLICVAVLVGGLVGPHLLASRSNSALASWALAAGVTVTVAALLLAANASYRRRSSRAWPR
ncbi:MAG: hypothetical protein ACRDLT_08435 [Solirubrobacteraceae bacterium]